MRHRLVSVRIGADSMATVRERSRRVGELFGLDALQRTRLVTAVSEVAHDAVRGAGDGTLTFLFDTDLPQGRGQALLAEISDSSAAPANPEHLVAGLPGRPDASRPGLAGVRRLPDHLSLQSPPGGGTVVTLAMQLPRTADLVARHEIDARIGELLQRAPPSLAEELQQQNRETTQALTELRRRQLDLEQCDLQKDEFLAILAHELRTPLATMNMILTVLRRRASVTPDELRDRSDAMSRQIAHLVRLVDDLTGVSRSARGEGALRSQAVEINALLGDALDMAAAKIEQRRQGVSFTPAQQELWVRGDAARLLHVFGSVIDNASKYTHEEGSIELRLRNVGANAVIEVADNGTGIAAEMLPQVFGMFVQARGRTGGDETGLGVGLTVADRVVRDHGGSISVKSEGLGRGSEFTVTLPMLESRPV